MTLFVLRRIGWSLATLMVVSLVIFVVLRLLPGDPVSTRFAQSDGVDAKAVAGMRTALGLDQPIIVQYFGWVGEVFTGNFGKSYFSGVAVSELLFQRLGPTVELSLAALLVGVVLALVVGVGPTVSRMKSVKLAADGFVTFALSAPSFIVGILLILLLATYVRWFPANGYVDPSISVSANLQRLVLPALTLGIYIAAPLARYIQGSIFDIKQETFVRTALGKGLTWRATTLRHIAPNALLPAMTALGVTIGSLIGGVVVVEQVFVWPGVGQLIIDAVFKRDYPILQAVVLLASAVFLATSLIIDILYGVVDPRLRVSQTQRRLPAPPTVRAAE